MDPEREAEVSASEGESGTGDPTLGAGEAAAEGIQKITESNLVSPRDASLVAGRIGIKALPEANSDAAALYGVSARQGRSITQRVSEILRNVNAEPLPAQAGSSPPEPYALVAAELALSPHPAHSDGSRALNVLRWQEQGLPVRRSRSDAAAISGSARVRQHRLRHHLRSRVGAVRASPIRSVGMPYLVVPMSLEARLLEVVPIAQRRRGRPPDLDWLASQVNALRLAYAERGASATDLARVVLWGFAQYPTSPDRSLEADGLHTAAAIARERGSLSAYWMAERVRYLVGDLDIRTIRSAHDSIIVLRNDDYWDRARTLLDESLRALDRSDIPDCDRSWIRQLLLSLAPFFFSGVKPVIDAETARAYSRAAWIFPYGYEDSYWHRQTRRAEFEIEYTVARRRSAACRERFWLGSGVLQRLDAAERAMQDSEEPMYTAQWSLLKMRLGIDRRDTSEIVASARGYLELGNRIPWIFRDHPSELRQYSRYRNLAIRKTRWLECELPQIGEVT